jgi:hypothetical protein
MIGIFYRATAQAALDAAIAALPINARILQMFRALRRPCAFSRAFCGILSHKGVMRPN